MSSSARSRLGAVILFATIAVVVIGGMSWATVATLELAEKNVLDEHEGKIKTAVNLIDSHMGGIRTAETMRNYKEYRALYDTQPLTIWTRDGFEAAGDEYVQLPSNLFENGPPLDWIDLYFQVNPDGRITSPQVLDEPVVGLTEGVMATSGCEPRRCRAWDWLVRVLPKINLGDAASTQAAGRGGESGESRPNVPLPYAAQHEHRPSTRRAYEDQRRKSLRDAQVGKLPEPDCVMPSVASRRISDRDRRAEYAEPPAPFEGEIEIKSGTFGKPFWVEPAPPDGPKLAFVRECTADATVFYQGFIGDWNLLKAELLEQVDGLKLFEQADLVPATDDDGPDPGLMVNLPVRLVVPDIPGGVRAAAWSTVRGTLIPSWIVGFAVLVVAGIGMRNLVLLMERRMHFAYAVTHELRTPLTTFRLYSDMLSAGLVPDEKKPEYLDTLNRESQRLSALVEDVLEYARLENHNVRLNTSTTNATAILKAISETLEQRCNANGIQARSANGIANGLVVRTDVDLIHRIAGVLVNNACRHARGAEGACVYVELSGDEHELHLDVSDTGPGVARADQYDIFKPFRRGRTAEHTAQGGIGLGLALARDWADLLGGKLELVERHHAQHGGAHFRLTIPTTLSA